MLGRKNYTREETDFGKAVISRQLDAYDELAKAVASGPAGKAIESAMEAFDGQFFNNMTLVLDRLFVHRLAGPNYEGTDGNPLNEVRILCDSLMTNNGMLRADKQIKLAPERSVLKLRVGDPAWLSRADFERLAAAFFAELERRFL